MNAPLTWLLTHALGTPYKWGGNGPTSYDCSGLALDFLRRCGLTLPDMRAADLYKAGRHVSELQPGRLVFYRSRITGQVSHVCIVLSTWLNGDAVLVGANGGGSNTLSLDDASRDGAYVGTCLYSRYRVGERLGIMDYGTGT